MFGIELAQDSQAFVSIGILLVMFVLFVKEVFPVEVTAIAGAAVMILLGILPYKEALGVLSNNAPWTIALMFMVMGGLVRTGSVEMLIGYAEAHVGSRPKMTIFVLYGFIAIASAFMNNTPLVAVMIPVVIQIAGRIGSSPSKMLIPLSHMTVMGGMISLIGTSTNLLVDGVVHSAGMPHFGLFEIAPLGIAVVIVGGLYQAVFARRLLPDRQSMASMLGERKRMKYFTEVAIPEDSVLIGTPVLEVQQFKRAGVRVIDVLRGDLSLRRDLAAVVLDAGDRVVLRTEMSELLDMQNRTDMRIVDKLSSVQTETVEVLITPGCRMIGRSLGEMRLRRRYGVYVLAAHRKSQNIGRQLDELVVQVGDTLLLEGSAEDIKRLADDMDMVDVSKPKQRAYRRGKAPIAIGALAAVVILSAMDFAPIYVLGLFAVTIILVTRCVDSDEALGFVDGRLLAMIFAMIAVGQGLEESGAVALIVTHVEPFMRELPPFAMIMVVYLLGVVLTEFLSNNAVAVLYTPIAIELARQLGADPRPFAVAVMFSATLAFATPIGYQTNMMVYGPGGYKFTDFTRIGIPLNIITWLLCSALIPLIWPLFP
ncbi:MULTISPECIES: SLC13 family permease [Gemmobacter]|jgi:di/tricarboxylate transporter|uniref:Di/tricarboxylate transporter n=2 Tax=Gemmobacter TaxID=204456 RepID=A0A2T6B4Z1_9RHOB|nr:MULTISPECIES: SLC13 family permease [Gemmobacter]OJY31870.1 MAG: dATP pyrophosphohydrolase [Rhodobacterales bacterium 65-51]PTX51146.1 di/tricarboxylate transporter [Gemmobacter caeni]TWJ01146.1 di/tricarboxylate transporter [Gemmobacter caeni]GHC18009.1 sodium:sulfate symporter [Gemmobacter nanjingensis]